MSERYELQAEDFIPVSGMIRYRERNLEGNALENWNRYSNQIFERGTLLMVYNAAIFVSGIAGLTALLDSLPK